MELIDYLLMGLAFIMGSVIGSFLNVLVYRLPAGMSIVKPGSHCFSCNEPIKWYDNIPILSYLILRGKCRHCGAKFSCQYCLVELFTGCFYLLTYLRFRYSITTILVCLLASCLIALSLIDWKYFIIPDSLNIAILVIAIVSMFVKEDIFKVAITTKLLTLAFTFVGILLIYIVEKIVKKDIMGWGDIKLFTVTGLFCGYQLALIGVFFGAIIACIVEIIIMRNKRKVIPFGPYLSIGFILAIFFGLQLLEWYTSLF